MKGVFRLILACLLPGASILLFPYFPFFVPLVACLSAAILARNIGEGALIGTAGSAIAIGVEVVFSSYLLYALTPLILPLIIAGFICGSLGGYAGKLRYRGQELTAKPSQVVLREPASSLWYFLPILLPLIGGPLGFFALRKKDPAKARNLLILGIAWTIIAFYYFIAMAQIGKGQY